MFAKRPPLPPAPVSTPDLRRTSELAASLDEGDWKVFRKRHTDASPRRTEKQVGEIVPGPVKKQTACFAGALRPGIIVLEHGTP
ncbi:hypothetical protein MRX96_044265 [Rhipicephalus microplus]